MGRGPPLSPTSAPRRGIRPRARPFPVGALIAARSDRAFGAQRTAMGRGPPLSPPSAPRWGGRPGARPSSVRALIAVRTGARGGHRGRRVPVPPPRRCRSCRRGATYSGSRGGRLRCPAGSCFPRPRSRRSGPVTSGAGGRASSPRGGALSGQETMTARSVGPICRVDGPNSVCGSWTAPMPTSMSLCGDSESGGASVLAPNSTARSARASRRGPATPAPPSPAVL